MSNRVDFSSITRQDFQPYLRSERAENKDDQYSNNANVKNIKASDERKDVVYSHDDEIKYNGKDGIVVVKPTAKDPYENYHVQSKLEALGFYNGPMDGNLKSDISRNAISLFQKVYGLSSNGDYNSSTKTKLEKAMISYSCITTGKGTKELKKSYSLDDREVVNMARTWAFFRVGMGLTAKQSAGIMGNFLEESRFSSDNARDTVYPGDHNSNYTFKSDDGVAYGIIQWLDSNRKAGLLNKANELGLAVSDINAQFAFLRQEMTSSVNGDASRKYYWEKFVATQKEVEGTCDAFRKYIEGTNEAKDARRKKGKDIYEAFSRC